MNHYPHHLGDYTKDTMHLSPLEHGVYRLLMDAYYATEKPIPLELTSACRIARCVTDNEREAVEAVLAQFFVRADDGYHQKRIDAEIESYRHKAMQNAKNGQFGGRPPNPNKTDRVSGGLAKRNPNVTLTSNQEPITKEKKNLSRATRLPKDWVLPHGWREWAIAERPDLGEILDSVADRFRDYWVAAPKGVKLDWEATWRNWVRNTNPPKGKPLAGVQPWDGAH